MNEQFKFDSQDYILKVIVRDKESYKIATFGDERHENLMGFYLGDDDKLNEIILYQLQDINLGRPSIEYVKDGPFEGCGTQYYIDYNDVGEPLILSDFVTYLDNDSLTFKFLDNPTDTEYNIGRITYGFDEDLYPTFLRVNNLVEDEYKQIMDNVEMRHIPIVKKKQLNNYDSIKEKIDKIAEEKGIKVLFSSMIGSKSWGYDVDNSDIDVRFVYKRNLDEILSMDSPLDTINMMEERDDFTGYDIKKFLSIILKQGVNAYEILYGNNIEENDVVKTLRSFAADVMQPDKIVSIYKNIVKQNIRHLDNTSTKKTKKIIENLRMMATSNYVEEKKEFPICNFETVLSTENNKSLKPLLEDLINKRKHGEEEVLITSELLNIFNEFTNDIKMDNKSNSKDNAVQMASQIYKDVVLNDKNKSL